MSVLIFMLMRLIVMLIRTLALCTKSDGQNLVHSFGRNLKSMRLIKIMSSERRAPLDTSDQQWGQRAGRSSFGSLYSKLSKKAVKPHLNFRLPKSQLETPPPGSLVLKAGARENHPTGDTLSATSRRDSNDTSAAHLMSHLMLTLM